MSTTILKIDRLGCFEFVEVEPDADGHIELETLQQGVGGLIERAQIQKPGCEMLDMWLNEEGKLINLPVNECATSLSGIWRFGDFIVGDVVVCAHDGEGNSVGLTDKQASTLRRFIAR